MSAARSRRSGSAQKPSDDEARRLQEEVCRLLIARVRDYAIFILDPNGRIISWNDGAERIKGYKADQIIGQHISRFYTPEDLERNRPEELLRIAREEGRVEDEGWRMRADGTRFWADVVITALYDDDGVLKGFGKVTRDLTERKKAEQERGELSERLQQFQDEERRRIAAELHDTTSPLLTNLVGKLYSLRERTRKDPAVEKALDETLTVAEATATMVRTVASLLSPPLLDQRGLLESLRWFLESFPRRTGMRIETHLPDLMPRLPLEHEAALLRAAQEWFTVLQAAGLKAASVRLTMTKDKVELRLERVDPPGARLDVPDLPVLLSVIRDRMRQLGGRLDTELNTSTTATFPVRGSSRTSG